MKEMRHRTLFSVSKISHVADFKGMEIQETQSLSLHGLFRSWVLNFRCEAGKVWQSTFSYMMPRVPRANDVEAQS